MLTEEPFYAMIVSLVAQVDSGLLYVVGRTSGFSQQSLYIFHHPLGLCYDITLEEDIAAIVDAGSA